ncbi:MAG TPA: dUTP diphosphatase [Candidatus Nanoarchaeia archaeon]|nr:dUTP diphosphatase [Candidatus Nanoarchaeia archaeon]
MVNIKIQKIKESATMPHYAHQGDAGVDLYAAEEYDLEAGKRVLVSTGIKIAVPPGYEAQVRPKSGLALEHGISIVNTPGTIDSGYRGEIGIIVINLGNKGYKIEKGKKIAQMVFTKVEEAVFEEVSELDKTSRNEGGFGSTGLKKR